MTSYLNSKFTPKLNEVLQNMVKLKIKSGKANLSTIIRISLNCCMYSALKNNIFFVQTLQSGNNFEILPAQLIFSSVKVKIVKR